MSIVKDFGKQLKRLRKKSGFTQEQLAEMIGLTQRQITRLETGKSFPSFPTLDAICNVLNITPVNLFDFYGEKLLQQSAELQNKFHSAGYINEVCNG